MRRSAAIAICSLIWCGGFWKTAPIRPSSRSPPIRACRSPKFCAGRRAASPARDDARNRKIPLPRDLYQPERHNSAGIEFGERASLDALLREVRDGTQRRAATAAPLLDGVALPGIERKMHSPIDGSIDRHRVVTATMPSPAPAVAAAAAGFAAWAATPVDERAAALERAADRLEAQSRPAARAAAERGRQDARRRARRIARGDRLLPLLRRAGAQRAGAAADAGTDRREQRAALSRPRRVRLHQPVEFSARDLPRPGRGGARRRQYRGRQAGRADAADRRARGRAAARSRRAEDARCILFPATARSAPAWSPIRASPASSSPARPKSAAPSTARSPRRTARSCR